MRWIRRSTVVPLSTLAIAITGVSFAHAACPPQDLVCLGEEAVGNGQGGVDGSVAPVTDAVDVVTGDVLDRVKDLLDGVGVDPPDPFGGGGHGGTHHPPGHGSQGTSHQAPPHGGAPNGHIPGGRGPHASIGSGPAPAEPARSLVRGHATVSGDRSDTVLEGVARSLAIVLTLFGLAVGFVAIQDRFDRSDPRLALAPVESDIVEFA
jgi:hypothetical protein